MKITFICSDKYPQLKVNSSNPFASLSDKERLEDLIDFMALLLAESQKGIEEGNKV